MCICIVYMLLCVKVHVYTCTDICVCVGGQRLALGVFLDFVLLSSLRQSFPISQELTDSTTVVSRLRLGFLSLCILSTGITGRLPYPLAFVLGTKDLNSGPHTCMTSALATEQP